MTDLSSTPVAYSGHTDSCAQNAPSCRLDKPIVTPEQMGKQQKTNLCGGDIMQKLSVLLFTVLFRLGLSACAPEVGSGKWRAQVKEKPKGDWSANEAADFAKHCIF